EGGEGGGGHLRRGPGGLGGRHPSPGAYGGPSDPAARPRLHLRRRHDRRLRFRHRNGQRRAADAVPDQDLGGALSAGDGPGDVVRPPGRDRRRQRTCAPHPSRAPGRAAARRAAAISGTVVGRRARADAHQKRVSRGVRGRFPISSEPKPLYTWRGRTIVRSHTITIWEVDVMADTSLSRRQLLAAASATTALGLLCTPAPAKAPMLNTPAPAFYRFKIGSIEATVVSDGPLAIGPDARTFRGPTADELGQMMSDHFLPADNVVLDQNVLVINTGDKLALFETGMSSVKRNDAMGRL